MKDESARMVRFILPPSSFILPIIGTSAHSSVFDAVCVVLRILVVFPELTGRCNRVELPCLARSTLPVRADDRSFGVPLLRGAER